MGPRKGHHRDGLHDAPQSRAGHVGGADVESVQEECSGLEMTHRCDGLPGGCSASQEDFCEGGACYSEEQRALDLESEELGFSRLLPV